MKVVLASSEAVPFAKTGGLADVAAALPKALGAAGHDVWLVLPYYRQLSGPLESTIHPTDVEFPIELGSKSVQARVFRSSLPETDVPVLLIDQPDYFDRPGLYQQDGHDYDDNCERFLFFSRSVLEAVARFEIRPDIVHANDWQTGIIPALLKIEYQETPEFSSTSSVFTIHNMAFQGSFWHWDMLLTGLDWKYFNWRQMEFFGNMNLLKTGIVFSDMVTTVSPTYAQEIQTPEFGCGLNGVLRGRGDSLVGILNGVDTAIWNPATDPHITENYDVNSYKTGKSVCKDHLQQAVSLPRRSDVPLFGMISRMTDQKGFDLIAGCAEDVLQEDLQFVFLGTGDSHYEEILKSLGDRYTDKVAAVIGFDEMLAHQIEASCDIYLMPSRFEPCGLNQMYSLAYGTVPLVHAVGGLADSVIDATTENIAAGHANGLSFNEYSPEQLAHQIRRAITLYHDESAWPQLVSTGMSRDWSWNQSATDYLAVYERALHSREAASQSL